MKKIIIEVADDEQAMQVVEEIETYVFRGYDTPPTMYVESAEIKVCEGCTGLDDANSHRCRADLASCIDWENCPDYIGEGNCACTECARTVSEKLAAIDRKENEEAWRKQAPKLGIHPDMHVKKSEREELGFYEEDRYV